MKTKEEFQLFYAQAKAMIETETDFTANLANMIVLIKEFYGDACS